MSKQELEVLNTVSTELLKIIDKYEKKAKKEQEKVNACYVTIKGEKVYTVEEILEYYECDCITSKQCDSYTEKLENKIKAKAGGTVTTSQRIVNYLKGVDSNVNDEIYSIKDRMKRHEEFEARRKDAIEVRGLSYTEFEREELERLENENEDKLGNNTKVNELF